MIFPCGIRKEMIDNAAIRKDLVYCYCYLKLYIMYKTNIVDSLKVSLYSPGVYN